MTDKSLPVRGDRSFEDLKNTNEHGAEYWSVRDLQPLLGYSQWRRFEDAVKRAIISCHQSGNNPDYHFAGAGKPITGGKDAVQVVDEYHLSRFACYLTRDKLARERVNSQQQAIRAHEDVGREVREAIKRIGGTMPENISPAEHIKAVEKRIKATPPMLELEEKDAKGLVGKVKQVGCHLIRTQNS